jgi:Tfp pilus assembly protein PilF
LLLRINELKKAKKLFETALEHNQKDTRALIGLANLFYSLTI